MSRRLRRAACTFLSLRVSQVSACRLPVFAWVAVTTAHKMQVPGMQVRGVDLGQRSDASLPPIPMTAQSSLDHTAPRSWQQVR